MVAHEVWGWSGGGLSRSEASSLSCTWQRSRDTWNIPATFCYRSEVWGPFTVFLFKADLLLCVSSPVNSSLWLHCLCLPITVTSALTNVKSRTFVSRRRFRVLPTRCCFSRRYVLQSRVWHVNSCYSNTWSLNVRIDTRILIIGWTNWWCFPQRKRSNDEPLCPEVPERNEPVSRLSTPAGHSGSQGATLDTEYGAQRLCPPAQTLSPNESWTASVKSHARTLNMEPVFRRILV